MRGLTFDNFKKSFDIGHQIDILYNDKYYQIFIGDVYIDYEEYSNKNKMPGDIFYGHWTFKPKIFIDFESMVREFLDFPFLEGKSINELKKEIYIPYSTRGY